MKGQGRVPAAPKTTHSNQAERIRDELRTSGDMSFRAVLSNEIGRLYSATPLGDSFSKFAAGYMARKVLVVVGEQKSLERMAVPAEPFRLGGFLAIHVVLADQQKATKRAVLGTSMLQTPTHRQQKPPPIDVHLRQFQQNLDREFRGFPDELQDAVYDAGVRASVPAPGESMNPYYAHEFRHGYTMAATNVERLIAVHSPEADAPRRVIAL